MLKSTFLLFAICASSLIWSQTHSKDKKFSIGLNFSPNLCFRTLPVEDTLNSYLNSHYQDLRNLREKRKLGFCSGIDIKWWMSQHFSLKSGLFYANDGYQARDIYWQDDQGIYNEGRSDIRYNFHFVKVPIKIEFNQSIKKFNFYISMGLSVDYLLKNQMRVELDYYDHIPKEKETFFLDRSNEPFWLYPGDAPTTTSKWYLSSLASFGIEYNLTPSLGIRLEPNISYGVSSTFEAPIKEYLYSGGVNFGIVYTFLD